jgi:hypothetical protein
MAIPSYTYLKLKMPGPKGSSLSRVALSKPTTTSKIVSPKQLHSPPLILPTAQAMTQKGHQGRKQPRQWWCSTD